MFICFVDPFEMMFNVHFFVDPFEIMFDVHLCLQTVTAVGRNKSRDIVLPITIIVLKSKRRSDFMSKYEKPKNTALFQRLQFITAIHI